MASLRDCVSKDPRECELLVTSSVRLFNLVATSRDRMSQAVLFINESEVPLDCEAVDEILCDEEFLKLVSTLGVGVDLSKFLGDLDRRMFDLEKLRYHKILLLTEKGPKGVRVRKQLLTWLFLYFNPLIRNGHVYSFEETPGKGISDLEFGAKFLSPAARSIRKTVAADTLSETLGHN